VGGISVPEKEEKEWNRTSLILGNNLILNSHVKSRRRKFNKETAKLSNAGEGSHHGRGNISKRNRRVYTKKKPWKEANSRNKSANKEPRRPKRGQA